jgi:hypothetical protein
MRVYEERRKKGSLAYYYDNSSIYFTYYDFLSIHDVYENFNKDNPNFARLLSLKRDFNRLNLALDTLNRIKKNNSSWVLY